MKTIQKLVLQFQKQLYRDHDCLIVITGAEGSGKSHLMLNILETLNPNADINTVAMNSKDFINILRKQKRYGTPVFDEAGDGLYSRDAMQGINKILNKAYMAIRGLNLFTILVLPDFFDLDSYFRKHRIKGLFQVYKRGHVKFWNKQQIDYINLKCSITRQIYIKPCIYDEFPIYKGQLANEYKELKDKKIQETLKNLDQSGNPLTNLSIKDQIIYLSLHLGIKPAEIVKIPNFKSKKSYIYQVLKEYNYEKAMI